VDDFTKECPAVEVDTSLPGQRAVRVLERLGVCPGIATIGEDSRQRSRIGQLDANGVRIIERKTHEKTAFWMEKTGQFLIENMLEEWV
jgi:hypothetical protein